MFINKFGHIKLNSNKIFYLNKSENLIKKKLKLNSKNLN